MEQIIEILVPPPQTTQLDYIEKLEESDEELMETTDSAQPDVESGPEMTTQLETPDPTPERLLEQSTEHQIASTTEISPEQETQTTTTDNQPSRHTNIAPRASEIDPEFQPGYILPEGSSQRAAHAIALTQTTGLSAFHGTFAAALSREANPSWRRYHRDTNAIATDSLRATPPPHPGVVDGRQPRDDRHSAEPGCVHAECRGTTPVLLR